AMANSISGPRRVNPAERGPLFGHVRGSSTGSSTRRAQRREDVLAFSDVLIPDIRMPRNERCQQFLALLRMHVDDLDAMFAQPIDSATKRARLAHDYFHDPELSDKAAAIPARRERRNHSGILVAPLTAGA